ncbi:MAG: hypothetical protein AB7U29_05260 [Desulfobulbus sp.]
MRQIQVRYFRLFCLFFLMIWAGPLTVTELWAQIPVPSRWQGEISGEVHGVAFNLPISLELSPPIAGEQNPFHVFVGTGEADQVGNVYLSSAVRVNTSQGPVTLQYLSVSAQDARFSVNLTQNHGAEAAKVNGFSGPNVSADQASNLMKDVLRSAWGASEMFGFTVGAEVEVEQRGNELVGSLAGSGRSYTGTSTDVIYRAQFKAVRVK